MIVKYWDVFRWYSTNSVVVNGIHDDSHILSYQEYDDNITEQFEGVLDALL